METQRKRNQDRVHIALLLLLSIVVLWSYAHCNKAADRCEKAKTNLELSRQAVNTIQAYSADSQIAGTQEKPDAEISRFVEKSASTAGILSKLIQGAYPGSPRRLSNSSFLEMPTEVPLKNVSLQQLITFLYDLSTGPAKLRVNKLRIEIPRNKEFQNNWDADIMLTYLVYAPDKKFSR